MKTIEKRLYSPGPKRILALDGGGIRGAITLGYLVRLEKFFRERYQKPDFLLRDYFDLIGGTSTGSIIAGAVAIGMETGEILKQYLAMGGHIFEQPAKWWQLAKLVRQNLFYKNKPAEIEGTLQTFFGDHSLGDDRIPMGLCIVTKRADTGSTWPFHNIPKGKYYGRNGNIPLWKIVRASSAAPTYFPPKELDYGNGLGMFIDGGVSQFNNPSLLLFMMSLLRGFHLNWEKGEEKLLLASFGTGTSVTKTDLSGINKMGKANALFWGTTVPDMFMRDASAFAELMLQSMSDSPTARTIDSEVGDMGGELCFGDKLLHYVRHNVTITEDTINQQASFTKNDPQNYPAVGSVADMMKMDKGDHVYHLAKIGELAAEKDLTQVAFDREFPVVFDV